MFRMSRAGGLVIAMLVIGCGEDGIGDIDVSETEYAIALAFPSEAYDEGEVEWCPDTASGSLESILFSHCDGEVEWERSNEILRGFCWDPSYPVLPNVDDQNPDSNRIWVFVTRACQHPDLALSADCDGPDSDRILAVEYHDGLYPALPKVEPFERGYCPVLARPL